MQLSFLLRKYAGVWTTGDGLLDGLPEPVTEGYLLGSSWILGGAGR